MMSDLLTYLNTYANIKVLYGTSMTLEKSLEQFGLTEKEARIYLAVLELGRDTVLNIANKAELKRPTVYLVLESLVEKGLVTRVSKGTTTIYIAENPNYLLGILKEREKSLQNILPNLRTIYNIDQKKPQIKFYEGRKNIERIWIEDTFKSPKIDFISSIAGLLEKYPDILPIFNRLSKQKKFVTRELVTRQPKDLKYAKKYYSLNRQIRVLSKEFQYTMDIDIYDNKVILASLKNDFLVLIESGDVAKSFKSLYNLAWQSAKKI